MTLCKSLPDDNIVLVSTPKSACGSSSRSWERLRRLAAPPLTGAGYADCYFDVPNDELLEALASDPRSIVVDEPGGPDQSAMLVRLFDRFRAGLCACGCPEADHGAVSFRSCTGCRCFAWRPDMAACRWYSRRAEQGDYRSVHPRHGGAFAR